MNACRGVCGAAFLLIPARRASAAMATKLTTTTDTSITAATPRA
jgi:hypothetical protein